MFLEEKLKMMKLIDGKPTVNILFKPSIQRFYFDFDFYLNKHTERFRMAIEFEWLNQIQFNSIQFKTQLQKHSKCIEYVYRMREAKSVFHCEIALRQHSKWSLEKIQHSILNANTDTHTHTRARARQIKYYFYESKIQQQQQQRQQQ